MPSTQVNGSLASSRKRRTLHPRTCDCGTDCEVEKVCKKIKASGNGEDKKRGQHKEEMEVIGQRRSLRLQESLWNRSHSQEKSVAVESPREVSSRRREKLVTPDVNKGEKRNDTVSRKSTLRARDSVNSDYKPNYPVSVESWDTRLRHRAKNSSSETKESKEEEDVSSRRKNYEDGKVLFGSSRKDKRKREKDLDDIGDGKSDFKGQEEAAESEERFVGWATKSKRKRRIFSGSESLRDDNGQQAQAHSQAQVRSQAQLQAQLQAQPQAQPQARPQAQPQAQPQSQSPDQPNARPIRLRLTLKRPSSVSNNVERSNGGLSNRVLPAADRVDGNERDKDHNANAIDDETFSSSSLIMPGTVDGKGFANQTCSSLPLIVPDSVDGKKTSSSQPLVVPDSANGKIHGKKTISSPPLVVPDLVDGKIQVRKISCSPSLVVPDSVDGKVQVKKTNSVNLLMEKTSIENDIDANVEVGIEVLLEGVPCRGKNVRKDLKYDETQVLANGGTKHDEPTVCLSDADCVTKDKESLVDEGSLHDDSILPPLEPSRRQVTEEHLDSEASDDLEGGATLPNSQSFHSEIGHKKNSHVVEECKNISFHLEDKNNVKKHQNEENSGMQIISGDENKNAHDIKSVESKVKKDIETNDVGCTCLDDAEAEADMMEIDPKVVKQKPGEQKQNIQDIDGEVTQKPDTACPQKDIQVEVVEKETSTVPEGRRCELCGGGNDGKPPKKLVRDGTDSENEISGVLQTATEDALYSDLDGFTNDPTWLGRLLGPLSDRLGITGIWVHRLCAVWSPEVYFSGVGCLKNVQAALARGRALKCSRCGRPGATIGCRVERCPRTYHLACGRAEGCFFDHSKFLMACTDHVNLFRPRGKLYLKELRRMREQKLTAELLKTSMAAMKKDLEEEEKWLETVGEDEEFLRRERKRFVRDVARVAPVYIGGTSSSDTNFKEGWESLAGLENVVQSMKEVVIFPLLYPEAFTTLGITAPKGILLHGYPGTGKTHAVRALVGACSRGNKKIAYFSRKGADCLGKYVGDAERQLRLLFQVAEECQPSIIFFDEIDGLAPKRSRQQDQTHSSVVSTLLALMDGLKSRGSIIVIGATNRPDDIDPALRRPGRFDREVSFPLPSIKDRELILQVHTRKWPEPPPSHLLSKVAEQTAGYAGADLSALCTQALMSALKRQFPLKELLNSSERPKETQGYPALPPITVKDIDWATALGQAPQPCSRRAACMAVNDVNALPLQKHMVPTLLRPLMLLLVSFHQDGRIFLPPKLIKAARSIEEILKSEENNSLSSSMRYCLQSLTLGSKTAKKIESILLSAGLIRDSLEFLPSDFLVSSKMNHDGDNDSCLEDRESCHKGIEGLKMSRGFSKCGFRVLINGSYMSGQKHLASCILHGFEGHVEIRKLDLSTMTFEGHGDILMGLTQILDSCRKIGACVIFMPNIEIWAVDSQTEDIDEYTSDSDLEEMKGREADSDKSDDGGPNITTYTWNALVQQVDSFPPDVPLIFLATCSLTGDSLPQNINKFFTRAEENESFLAVKKTIPRFSVQLPLSVDEKLIMDSSAKMVIHELVKRYTGFVHDKSHANDVFQKKFETAQSYRVQNKDFKEEIPQSLCKIDLLGKEGNNARSLKAIIIEKADADSKPEKNSNSGKSNDGAIMSNEKPEKKDVQTSDYREQNLNSTPHKNSAYGAGKARSTLQQVIASCGYQLLCSPQFAELCWITSKLEDGPFSSTDGPWKGWPFNPCSAQTQESVTNNTGDANDVKDSPIKTSVVRGLAAVGLHALKGTYSTAQEVAFSVRKVLEILVHKIRLRSQNKKNHLQYFHILTQVAALEDIINNWAYNLKSLESNCCANAVDHNKHSEAMPDKAPEVVCDSKRTNNQPQNIPDMVPLSPKTGEWDSHPSSNAELESFSEATQKNAISDPECLEGKATQKPQNANDMSIQDSSTVGSVKEREKSNPEAVGKTDSKCHGVSASFVDMKDRGGLSPCQKSSQNIKSVIDSEGSDTSSELHCAYQSCSECMNSLYSLVKQFFLKCWKEEGCHTELERVHDLVGFCTVNLLSILSGFGNSKTATDSGTLRKLGTFDSQLCCCSDVCNFKNKESNREERSANIEDTNKECQCHLSLRKRTKRKHAQEKDVIFIFEGHNLKSVVESLDQFQNSDIHCQAVHLCLCPLIQKLSHLLQLDS